MSIEDVSRYADAALSLGKLAFSVGQAIYNLVTMSPEELVAIKEEADRSVDAIDGIAKRTGDAHDARDAEAVRILEAKKFPPASPAAKVFRAADLMSGGDDDKK